jgi:hypothetical protein
MAKRRSGRPARVAKARSVRSSPHRVVVTRAEYNGIIDILNERSAVLNAIREAIERLERADEVQLARTAQLQVELDLIKRVLGRAEPS